ncbi:MAG TPA: tetraacyldisaccharide 4'-kinase [Candidatus Omnitrophica bacterium]|nr:tetraacyldisaccharide 4'-kinase [Candidatus Omnitrophota bacterium]
MKGLKAVYTRNQLTATYFILWPVLFVFSFFYLLIIIFLKTLYQRHILASYRPNAKVISVGNITLGGSGKTPLVEYLALYLHARGRRTAVLLRGYKKPGHGPGIGFSDYYSLGDEACMLKLSLKENAVVVSGKDRVRAAVGIDEEGRIDTIILDDGFQHWRLKRDLDVAVVDATNPFGNGCVLPLGPLRESIASLARAQVICLARANEVPPAAARKLEERLRKLNHAALFIKAIHEPEFIYDAVSGLRSALDHLKGKKVGLLCAIANPGSFLDAVERCGAEVVAKTFFDDHHEYSGRELSDVMRKSLDAGARAVVTTQKDIVKFAGWLCRQDAGIEVFVLKVSLKIVEGEEAFDERLHSLYSA